MWNSASSDSNPEYGRVHFVMWHCWAWACWDSGAQAGELICWGNPLPTALLSLWPLHKGTVLCIRMQHLCVELGLKAVPGKRMMNWELPGCLQWGSATQDRQADAHLCAGQQITQEEEGREIFSGYSEGGERQKEPLAPFSRTVVSCRCESHRNPLSLSIL